MKTAVIGSGAWGTALAVRLCKNGHDTVLWNAREERVARMRQTRINSRLPDISLPEELDLSSDCGCVENRELVVMATPSTVIRRVCREIAPYLAPEAVMVCVTKGLESGTLMRMSQVVEQETGRSVVLLTGPSHAEELAREIPTGCVAACENQSLAQKVQDAFMADCFRIYTSCDVIGAELGGALKNVIAIAAGILDGIVKQSCNAKLEFII